MDSCFAGQIKYLRDQGIEGHIADSTIYFGKGVSAGTVSPNSGNTGSASMGSVKVPATNSDVFRGIALQKHTEQAYPFVANTPSGHYVESETVDVFRRGVVVVLVTGTVTVDGSTVYCTVGANGGVFTSDSGSNLTVPTGTFRSGSITLSNGDTVADLEINLP
jgi:hypothetical protein